MERQVKHSSVRFEHNDMIRIRSYRTSKIIITVNNHWLKHLQWLIQVQLLQNLSGFLLIVPQHYCDSSTNIPQKYNNKKLQRSQNVSLVKKLIKQQAKD